MTEAELRAKFKKFIGPGEQSKLVVVKNVDEDNCTCTVTDDDVDITGVLLRPVSGANTGIVTIPEVNSKILITNIESGEHKIIIAAEKIKKQIILIDGVKLEIVDGNVILNDGENGAVPILKEILDSLESIKTYCETMKTAVSTGISAVGAAMAANGATGAAAFDVAMATASITISNDMGNEKFKH